jgi:hypothetical protein
MNTCSIRLTAETQSQLEEWVEYLGDKGLQIDWDPISIYRGADVTRYYCNGVLHQMTGATDKYPLRDEKIHGW